MIANDDRRVRRLERRAFPSDDLDRIPDEVLDAILWGGMPDEIARMRAAADAGDAKMAARLAAIREALA